MLIDTFNAANACVTSGRVDMVFRGNLILIFPSFWTLFKYRAFLLLTAIVILSS